MRDRLCEIADRKIALEDKERQLREELMRLALAQNPDLARQLVELTTAQIEVKNDRLHERIRIYNDWKAEQEAKARAENPRKIKYDDRRNVNALKGIRRRCDYRYSSREEQIQMEINEYYQPRGLEIPCELENELMRIRLAHGSPQLTESISSSSIAS